MFFDSSDTKLCELRFELDETHLTRRGGICEEWVAEDSTCKYKIYIQGPWYWQDMIFGVDVSTKILNTLEMGAEESHTMSVDEMLPFPLIFSFLSLAVTASSTPWISPVLCSSAVVEDE